MTNACARWPLDPSCLSESWADLSPAVQERSILLASATLNRLTGYRVGNCPITIRPQHRTTCAAWGYMMSWGYDYGYQPINYGGIWTNCGCPAVQVDSSVRLPAPVGRIDEVKVDGVVLDEDDYRVDNGNLLVWQGVGDAPWPRVQTLNWPDTEVGTFSITYLNAYPVDDGGKYAVATLANEFAKACTGGSCELPPNVVSVVRQGVVFEIEGGAFPNGFTGIRAVDTWIALWNPSGSTGPSRVWSPDISPTRTTR